MKFNIDADEFVLDSKKKISSKEQPVIQEEKTTSEPIVVLEDKPAESKKVEDKSKEPEKAVIEEPFTKEEKARPEKKSSEANSSKEKKHPGGRPKKEITRKQYTLTLREDDYKKAMAQAAEEDISFAKLVEKALRQYLDY